MADWISFNPLCERFCRQGNSLTSFPLWEELRDRFHSVQTNITRLDPYHSSLWQRFSICGERVSSNYDSTFGDWVLLQFYAVMMLTCQCRWRQVDVLVLWLVNRKLFGYLITCEQAPQPLPLRELAHTRFFFSSHNRPWGNIAWPANAAYVKETFQDTNLVLMQCSSGGTRSVSL